MYKITLKAARVNVGLTQEEVAQILGVSRDTIRSWEQGKSFPREKKHLDGLCELYKVSYDNIIFLPSTNA